MISEISARASRFAFWFGSLARNGLIGGRVAGVNAAEVVAGRFGVGETGVVAADAGGRDAEGATGARGATGATVGAVGGVTDGNAGDAGLGAAGAVGGAARNGEVGGPAGALCGILGGAAGGACVGDVDIGGALDGAAAGPRSDIRGVRVSIGGVGSVAGGRGDGAAAGVGAVGAPGFACVAG